MNLCHFSTNNAQLWYVGNIRSAQSSGRNFWWQQKWYFLKDFRLIDISHGYLVNRSGGTKILVPALFGKKKGFFCLAKIIVHTFGKNSYLKSLRSEVVFCTLIRIICLILRSFEELWNHEVLSLIVEFVKFQAKNVFFSK